MKLRSGKVINGTEFEELCSAISANVYQDKVLTISNDWEGEAEHLLEDADIVFLADALKKNKYIKELDLSWNAIGDNGAYELSQVESLESINLAYNEISSDGAKLLALLPRLHSLELTKNILTIGDLSGFVYIVNHSNIEVLYIDNNNLSQDIVVELLGE